MTPCFRESERTLEAMLQSVLAQRVPCCHILVSDGVPRRLPPSAWRAYEARGHRLVYLQLPMRTRNSGAAPRALGAAWAFSQGAEWVSFLDADNTFDANHLESVAAAAEQAPDAVIAGRRVFLKETGEQTPIEESERRGEHFDTNSLTLSRSAGDLLAAWAFWPSQFGTGEDRVLSALLLGRGGRLQQTGQTSVNYYSEWPIHYQLAGKPVPESARRPRRRAGTHFHASSFLNLIGQRPIPARWANIPAKPLALPRGEPMVVQLMAHLPQEEAERRKMLASLGRSPACFTDLVVTEDTVEADSLGPNRPVLQLPSNERDTLFQVAVCAILAFHQGRRGLLVHLSASAQPSHEQDDRLRELANGWNSRDVGIITYPVGDGAKGASLIAATALGELWTQLALRRHDRGAEALRLTELVDACRDAGETVQVSELAHWPVQGVSRLNE